VAYQLYLLGEVVERALGNLGDKLQYAADVRGYIDLCIFSLVCKALRDLGVDPGRDDLNEYLSERGSHVPPTWEKAIKGLVAHTLGDYKAAARRVSREEGRTLSHSNYFKSGLLTDGLLSRRIPSKLHVIARDIRGRRWNESRLKEGFICPMPMKWNDIHTGFRGQYLIGYPSMPHMSMHGVIPDARQQTKR
jgi:hypothetical protein